MNIYFKVLKTDKKIKVGENWYKLYSCKKIKDKDDYDGYILHNEKILLLNNNNSDKVKKITLVHEILHGLIFQMEEKEYHKKKIRSIRKNEKFIESLSLLLLKSFDIKFKIK
jgi:Zn-dependent peptidase ImmA (M78 family)